MDRPPAIVAVTGASAGVGRACAIRFAREGCRLALLARGRAGLEGARSDALAAGAPECLIVECDVADADAVEAAVARIERELGAIDTWVNVAMVTVFGEFKDVSAEEFRRVTEVTYLGYVYATRSVLQRMLERDRGTIVQIGSALAYRAIPLQSAYCGAKHAIRGFTEALRCELLHDKSRVRVAMVDLPALNTPQFGWSRTKVARKAQPVPPIYQPEVAADAVYYVATSHRREVFLGWPTVLAILSDRIAPAIGDRYLARRGFAQQQLDDPVEANHRDNLFAPLDAQRDYGAHGAFDRRSQGFSVQFWFTRHRRSLLAAGIVLVAVGLAARRG